MNSKLFQILILIAIFSTSFYSCEKKKTTIPDDNTEAPKTVTNPLSGHYVWKFEIPGLGTQESHLTFYTDSTQYIMIGPAYNTNYMMIQESYTENDNEKRWIGVGKGGSIPKDGVYFVIFIKDIADNTVKIYKRECNGGKEEAENFPYPEPDATADHGWNTYVK